MSDKVLVSWRDCTCEWQTKYCDEEHVRSAFIPTYALDDVFREFCPEALEESASE